MSAAGAVHGPTDQRLLNVAAGMVTWAHRPEASEMRVAAGMVAVGPCHLPGSDTQKLRPCMHGTTVTVTPFEQPLPMLTAQDINAGTMLFAWTSYPVNALKLVECSRTEVNIFLARREHAHPQSTLQ